MTKESHIKLELHDLLARQDFRKFIREVLFVNASILGSAMTEDPRTTAYNLGRQAIGFDILNKLTEAEPEALAQLLLTEKTDERD